MSGPRGEQIAALVRMARPTTLPGGILAYILGAAMGYGHAGTFDWGLAVVGLIVTEVTNLVASYADEYADVDTDTLVRRTLFSGGSGVLPSEVVPTAWALRAAVVSVTLSVLLTTVLIAMGVLSPHVAWIVGLGLVGGWFYSMPPVQLERRGLGEIDNALIGGILMPLMGYTVQVGRPSLDTLLALLPLFLIVLVNLLGVHWPDREADAAVGKRSLVVIAGHRVRLLHHALVAAAYLLALALTGPVRFCRCRWRPLSYARCLSTCGRRRFLPGSAPRCRAPSPWRALSPWRQRAGPWWRWGASSLSETVCSARLSAFLWRQSAHYEPKLSAPLRLCASALRADFTMALVYELPLPARNACTLCTKQSRLRGIAIYVKITHGLHDRPRRPGAAV